MAEINIAEMRRQYSETGISKADMLADPIEQFRTWFDQAVATSDQEWMETNAMTLATSDGQGHVSSRTVLLKGLAPEGLTFYTCYDSQKGQQLAENPRAALLFYWGQLSRQVRIEGSVEKAPRKASGDYFHNRPRASQLSAAISAQSLAISSRAELESKVAELEKSLDGQPVPLPENWGGYFLKPDYFEFWQGRINRLHDRIVYRNDGASWTVERIQP